MSDPTDPASSKKPDNREGSQNAPTPVDGQSGTAQDAGPDVAPVVKNTPWPRLARAADVSDRLPPGSERRPGNDLFALRTMILAQVFGFGLLLGGFFLGQAWSRPSKDAANSDGKAGPAWTKVPRASSERSLDAASRALKAERVRDFRQARAIYEEMIKRQAPLPGAEYRLALLSLHEGDFLQTELHLDRSLTSGDDMADCYLLRASLAGMKSNYADASVQLAAAVRAAPFSARFCFCWGESLRREGKLEPAIQRLTQALDRPDSGPARELYQFKLRLAQVEEGSDERFNAELTGHLGSAAPNGDWLLLAAAQAIGRHEFAAAAAHLEKARGALGGETFGIYVQDYLFQTQAARPELRAYLAVPPPANGPAKGAPIQDPAVWTPAEADPAVWPPFPTPE